MPWAWQMPLSTLPPADKTKPLKWCRNLLHAEKWYLINTGSSLSWNNKRTPFIVLGKCSPIFFPVTQKDIAFPVYVDSSWQNFPRTVALRDASCHKLFTSLQVHPHDRAMSWMQMGVLLKLIFFQKLCFLTMIKTLQNFPSNNWCHVPKSCCYRYGTVRWWGRESKKPCDKSHVG